MVTVIAGSFVVGEFMRPEHPPAMRRPIETIVSEYAQVAAQEYEGGGKTALTAYLDRVQSESNIRAFLFNSQLQELSGRRIPHGAPALAKVVFETRGPDSGTDGPPPLLARPAVTSSG